MNSFHLPRHIHFLSPVFPVEPETIRSTVLGGDLWLNGGKDASSQSCRRGAVPCREVLSPLAVAERTFILTWVKWKMSYAEPKLPQVLLFINVYQILNIAGFPFSSTLTS